ncbi:hypothetical protein ACFFX0_29360 [Citricoccus parietis]|uniref:Uncharacterized protein n=1 Tax=Citricoccus parietis TaxID=592307 RepID=A0ABV5G4P2_9MICC
MARAACPCVLPSGWSSAPSALCDSSKTTPASIDPVHWWCALTSQS